MENSHLAIFDEFWPTTLVQGIWPDFGATLKIHKKSNFDRNELKLSAQHKYMYMYQKKLLEWRIPTLPFLMNFGRRPCTIVQGIWPDFGATSKIHKKSNFDRNELKLSTQHKYMYMYLKKL